MSNAGRKAAIAITGILLGTTLIGGSLVGQELLARTLEPKAAKEIADAGFTNIDVKFKGREAYLTGHGKTEREMERACKLVESMKGVRWARIEGNTDAPATGDPTDTTSPQVVGENEPTVSIKQGTEGVVLTGRVSTQEEADNLVAEAERVFGSPVDNQLVVNPDVDSQVWVTDLTHALSVSPPITGGSLEANSLGITLGGEVANDTDAAALSSAMDTVHLPFTNGITVAQAPTAELTDDEIATINNTVIGFSMKSYELDTTAQQQLDKVVPLLNKSTKNLTIRGYLSSPHQEQNQARDSKARAQAVADYLISKGVPSSRIIVEGRGTADPIASNDTAAGRVANQRATLTLS
ncbi:MAG: OmpA family protein [Propionibacteriaceae bacterium]|nr:OmpA family protein [Propionibacteriaceae bacterium]